MKDLNKSKNEDVVLHSIEEINKLALSFIPAGAIFDSFWGYRTRLKQKRILDFSESVKKVLEQFANRELHGNDFESEDFVDIMESVYSKVIATKSIQKLERFRNILARQVLFKPVENQTTLIFINLIENLSDIQLMILDWLDKNQFSTLGKIHSYLEDRGIVILSENESEFEILYNDSTLHITDFIVYIKDLISRGLIDEFEVDLKVVTTNDLQKAFSEYYKKIDAGKLTLSNTKIVHKISPYGKRFLNNIQSLNGVW